MNVQPLGTEAEKVTVVGYNSSGATIEKGMGVAWNLQTAASMNGSDVVKLDATAAGTGGFIGVANNDIANNNYGVITCWGYVASVLLSHVGTSITIGAGNLLRIGAVAGTFFSGATIQATSNNFFKYVVAASNNINTISTKATAYCAGIVRAI
jgi:hypothetical protein